MEGLIGKTISHYLILDRLGAGGMGVVYKAQDTKLDRVVALKFLPKHLLCDEETKTRFAHEAKAASALNHTNITTIYEIDEVEDQCFISMEYIEGKSIKELLKEKTLSLKEILDIATQVGEGLNAAHKKDIIHRDIKSDNIMLTQEGGVKIMDFGLAKLKGATKVTKTGATLGTTHYMSPEQTQGMEVDQRSDIFSFGVVLYEMITSQLPFKGEHEAAVIHSIVNETPEPLARYKANVPEGLQRIVVKALAKKRGERYQYIDDLLADLRREKKRLEYAKSPSKEIKTKPKRKLLIDFLIAVFAGILVYFITVIVLPKIDIFKKEKPTVMENSLAIMYFKNWVDTADTDNLGEMVTDLLITDLSESQYLPVLSAQRLYDILKSLGKEGSKVIDRSVASEVATKAGVKWMLLGSILKIQPQIILTYQLVEVTTGNVIASERIEGDVNEEIFSLVDTVTVEIKKDLPLPAAAQKEEDPPIADVTTHSIEAYKLYYALGRSLYLGDDPQKSIPLVKRAVELDSTFVKAYRALAILYNSIGDSRNALLNAQKAKEFSKERDTTEFFRSVIIEYKVQGNWDQSIKYMKRLLERKPDDIQMHLQLGYTLSRYKKKFDRAIPHFKRVIALDPKNLSGQLGPAYNYLGHAYLYLGQFEKAMDALNQYQSIAPNKPDPLHSIADALSFKGEYKQAIAQYSEIIRKYPSFYESYEDLGLTYLAVGKWREALSSFKQYLATAPQGLLPKGHILRGKVYFIQENIPLAQKEIDEALALDSLSLQAHWLRGLVTLTLSGNLDGARKDLQDMEELIEHPSALDEMSYYHHLNGWILLTENKITEGLEALRNAAEVSPRNFIYFRKEVIHGYLICGLPKEAIQEASSLLALNDNDGEVLYLLGLAYMQDGALDRAVIFFRRAHRVWEEADADFRPLEELKSKLEEMT